MTYHSSTINGTILYFLLTDDWRRYIPIITDPGCTCIVCEFFAHATYSHTIRFNRQSSSSQFICYDRTLAIDAIFFGFAIMRIRVLHVSLVSIKPSSDISSDALVATLMKDELSLMK